MRGLRRKGTTATCSSRELAGCWLPGRPPPVAAGEAAWHAPHLGVRIRVLGQRLTNPGVLGQPASQLAPHPDEGELEHIEHPVGRHQQRQHHRQLNRGAERRYIELVEAGGRPHRCPACWLAQLCLLSEPSEYHYTSLNGPAVLTTAGQRPKMPPLQSSGWPTHAAQPGRVCLKWERSSQSDLELPRLSVGAGCCHLRKAVRKIKAFEE